MAENSQFDLIWNKIREKAEAHINPITFNTYISGLVPVDVVNKKLVLRANTELTAGVVEKKFLPVFL